MLSGQVLLVTYSKQIQSSIAPVHAVWSENVNSVAKLPIDFTKGVEQRVLDSRSVPEPPDYFLCNIFPEIW